MVRLFIVHRWDGNPHADWYPWLKEELEKKGIHVVVPLMPNPASPTIDLWVKTLQTAVGTADEETYFVGHSVGCQTILRYLEKLSGAIRVGGVLFVAGWFTLSKTVTDSKEAAAIAKPWLQTPLHREKIKQEIKTNFITFLSDDDPYVPLEENRRLFKELGAQVVVEHGMGHYDSDNGLLKVPSVLAALEKMIKKR